MLSFPPTKKITEWLASSLGVDPKPPNSYTKISLFETFQPPIAYASVAATVSETVAADLELFSPGPLLNIVLGTNDIASQKMLGEKYTTHFEFLKDTQKWLKKATPPCSVFVVSDIDLIWADLKTDSYFLEKYSFMEWSVLEPLNKSVAFLQGFSMTNLLSPLVSFIMPIILFLIPFVLIRLRGVGLSLGVYVELLKEVAKNHLIGKLFSIHEFSVGTFVYALLMVGMYLFSMYSNIIVCDRYHTNLKKINKNLLTIRDFVASATDSIVASGEVIQTLRTYAPFWKETERHLAVLRRLHGVLKPVSEFSLSWEQVMTMGDHFELYYELHQNDEYENALSFAVGWMIWMNSVRTLQNHLFAGRMNFAVFDMDAVVSDTDIKNQWYPVLEQDVAIVNSVNLNKNIVLTAPNAAGKTTVLKTTLLNLILTQQFGCGFYQECHVPRLYDHFHSYLNIVDCSERDSLFQAESRRCKNILTTIEESGEEKRHMIIFDELFSGTNPNDSVKACVSFLQYLNKCDHVDFMLTTHFVEICRQLEESVNKKKMLVNVLENGSFEYLYEMMDGVSEIEGGYNVLKDMEFPTEILDGFIGRGGAT